jgi:hypothetical protein
MNPTTVARKRVAPSRSGRAPRTFRLTVAKIEAAKRALGVATATEAIEQALDLVVFRRDLIAGTRAMLGVRLASPDPDR